MAKRLLTNSFEVQRSHGNEGVSLRDGVVNMLRGKSQYPIFQWLLAALLLQSVGCGGGGVPATEEAARGALTATLDAWKAGRKVEEMRQKSPKSSWVMRTGSWAGGLWVTKLAQACSTAKTSAFL